MLKRTDARLDVSEHRRHGWLIGDIAADFDLIDAWALPVTGTQDQFAELVGVLAATGLEPAEPSLASKVLFGVRSKMGDLFGWDDQVNTLPIPGCNETSLRDRLPDDIDPGRAERLGGSPFRPVYRTDREWALEVSNRTVHAALHIGWADQGGDRHRAQLGVYVKTRGRLGRPYMAAIAPFRHLVIYPELVGRIGDAWAEHVAGGREGGSTA